MPYEESSVFSQVNILNPNLSLHEKFLDCRPYIIELEPGDTLFIPHHWWHFVQNINADFSISINVWLNDNNHLDLLNETIVKLISNSLCPLFIEENRWSNDNQVDSDPNQLVKYIKLFAERCEQSNYKVCGQLEDELSPNFTPLKCSSFAELSELLNYKSESLKAINSRTPDEREVKGRILNSFLSENVINSISSNIINSLKLNN